MSKENNTYYIVVRDPTSTTVWRFNFNCIRVYATGIGSKKDHLISNILRFYKHEGQIVMNGLPIIKGFVRICDIGIFGSIVCKSFYVFYGWSMRGQFFGFALYWLIDSGSLAEIAIKINLYIHIKGKSDWLIHPRIAQTWARNLRYGTRIPLMTY